MTDFGAVRGSIRGLGPGAYLVNVLPSAVLVAGVLALGASQLYPWADPAVTDGQAVSPGPASVLAAVRNLDAAGGIALAATVLVVTVLIRPFQISAVQMLEGYWRERRWLSPVESYAVERHVWRRSVSRARTLPVPQDVVPPSFGAVAAQARRVRRNSRRRSGARAIAGQYPESPDLVLPTLLGNVLRRAETTAGERYGLDTVTSYPRLHPFLSPRLSQESETQLNVIDTAATLTIVFGCLAAAAAPLSVRLDAWALVPVVLAVVSGLSYRGARIAAGRQGVLLAAAFDLHRFDMLAGMHRKLPEDADEEYRENQALSEVLRGEPPTAKALRWRYVHPDPVRPIGDGADQP